MQLLDNGLGRAGRGNKTEVNRRQVGKAELGEVTHDVPADALAIARSRQVVKENRAARLRAMKATAKKTGGTGE